MNTNNFLSDEEKEIYLSKLEILLKKAKIANVKIEKFEITDKFQRYAPKGQKAVHTLFWVGQDAFSDDEIDDLVFLPIIIKKSDINS